MASFPTPASDNWLAGTREFDMADSAVRDAARVTATYGKNALEEVRYRLMVAQNRRDLKALAHWSAVSDIVFRRRFGIRPGQALRVSPQRAGNVVQA